MGQKKHFLKIEWSLYKTNLGLLVAVAILLVLYCFLLPFSPLMAGATQLVVVGGGGVLFVVAYLPFFVTVEKGQTVSMEGKLLCHAMTKSRFLKNRYCILLLFLGFLTMLVTVFSVPAAFICGEAFSGTLLLYELLGLWCAAFCYAGTLFFISSHAATVVLPGMVGFVTGFLVSITSGVEARTLEKEDMWLQLVVTGIAAAVFHLIYLIKLRRCTRRG